MGNSHVRIRRMLLADLDQVFQIDQLSFSLPWPETSFYYEVEVNLNSTCWVAEIEKDTAPALNPTLTSEDRPPDPGEKNRVVGMAVIWLVVDEAHIATIAVHPEFRELGIGKQMLTEILEDSRRRGMVTATLEVRAGNRIAQTMYQSFGFEVKGVRRHYYKDNQEDALIMTADLAKTLGVPEISKVSKPKASKTNTAEGD